MPRGRKFLAETPRPGLSRGQGGDGGAQSMGLCPCGLTGRGRTVERTVPAGLWPEERPRGSKDSGQRAGPEGTGRSCRASGVRGTTVSPAGWRGRHGAAWGPEGAAECVGRLWSRVASRTPSLPLPLPLRVPVLAVPRFPWPREGGSMAARPLDIFASGDPGPASWGQEVTSCPVVQALSPSARQAQGGFAGGHTPLRPLGGSPQG